MAAWNVSQAPQWLSMASLLNLEARFRAAGLDTQAMGDLRALSAPWWPHTQAWMKDAAAALAMAASHAACLLDLDGMIVDGHLPRPVLTALMREIDTALSHCNWEGVVRPEPMPGTVGPDARALGGALLPLYAHFAPDKDVFLKTMAG